MGKIGNDKHFEIQRAVPHNEEFTPEMLTHSFTKHWCELFNGKPET